MSILNLTQHVATPEQIAQGVVDLSAEHRAILSGWLTFESLPTQAVLRDRAALIAGAAAGDSKSIKIPAHKRAMIGGAPFLMAPLEEALRDHGIEPVYAFSMRESVDQHMPDGSVRKVNVFRHAGFVE